MHFILVSDTYKVLEHADNPTVTTPEASKNPNDLPSTVTGALPNGGNACGVTLDITGPS
jgi:hypothetical protein